MENRDNTLSATRRRQAAEDYGHQQTEIRARLQEITAAVNAHAKAIVGDINFGHVGDLQHVRAKLDEVLGFLVGEDAVRALGSVK